jgi:hypothetical protein
MTPSQRRVLEWLLAYPGVHLIGHADGIVNWNAMWASEEAREHMVGVVEQLGGDASGTGPRTLPLPGATPRCTRATFLSLQRRGWLRMLAHGRPGKNGSWRATYQISRPGLDALAGEHERGVPMEQPQPRAMQTCECGWSGRSMGGHRSGPWHQEWLAVQRYRAALISDKAR